MSRNKRKPRYFSFLLRLWETKDGERQVWCASLEFPATGVRRGFASLDELFAFLENEVCADTDSPFPDQITDTGT